MLMSFQTKFVLVCFLQAPSDVQKNGWESDWWGNRMWSAQNSCCRCINLQDPYQTSNPAKHQLWLGSLHKEWYGSAGCCTSRGEELHVSWYFKMDVAQAEKSYVFNDTSRWTLDKQRRRVTCEMILQDGGCTSRGEELHVQWYFKMDVAQAEKSYMCNDTSRWMLHMQRRRVTCVMILEDGRCTSRGEELHVQWYFKMDVA